MVDAVIQIGFWAIVFLGGLVGLSVLSGLSVLLCVGAYAGVANVVGELRVRRRMQLAGRFLPRRKALAQIAESRGTLIVESPTIGWAVTRAWWTADDVLARTPVPPPGASERAPDVLSRHPFTKWCHEHYTDLEAGAARLIAVYNGQRSAKRVASRFPGIKIVELWSGGLMLRGVPEQGGCGGTGRMLGPLQGPG